MANKLKKNTFKTISKNFGYNFKMDIVMRDRVIIRNKPGINLFRNESDESLTLRGCITEFEKKYLIASKR